MINKLPELLSYGSYVLILVLNGLLLVVLLSYYNLVKKYFSVEKKLERLEDKRGKGANEIMDSAKKRAHAIVEDAQKKVQEMLSEAEVFDKSISENLSAELGRVSEEITRHYQEILETEKDKMVGMVQEVSNLVKEQTLGDVLAIKNKLEETVSETKQLTLSEAETFKQALMDEVVRVRDQSLKQTEAFQAAMKEEASSMKEKTLEEVGAFQEALRQELSKVKEAAQIAVEDERKRVTVEVEAYKKQRLEQVDKAVSKILQDVSSKVLRRSLSMEDHEELVMNALREAKDANVF